MSDSPFPPSIRSLISPRDGSGGFDLLDYFRFRRDAMLARLRELVEHESPSGDKARLDALAATLADRFGAVGGSAEVLANPQGGDHVLVRFFKDAPVGPPALLVGHFDTVWPVGTLAGMPFRVEGGRAFGPGCFDMKASLVIAEFALGAIRELGLASPRPVDLLLTSDEEVGSPTSRGLIEDLARRSAFALILEPALPDGSLKTARKGVGLFTMTVEGQPAHAGVEPEKGRSAIVELAHQILGLQGLNDPSSGVSVNVGTIEGGFAPNVVAPHATARIDVRVVTAEQAGRVEAAIRGVRPITPGTAVEIRGGFNRPPMVRTPAVADLFGRARAIGRTVGLDLGEGSTGGGSDGNFTAAVGLPTIDGLGARGGGAHARDERVEVDSLVERAALLCSLLLQL